MAFLVISIGELSLLAPTLDSADPLFALVKIPGFYLHNVEGADQDPASGSLCTSSSTTHYAILYYYTK